MYLFIEFFIVKPIEYHDVAEFKNLVDKKVSKFL